MKVSLAFKPKKPLDRAPLKELNVRNWLAQSNPTYFMEGILDSILRI